MNEKDTKNKCKSVNDITAPHPPKKNLEKYFEVIFLGLVAETVQQKAKIL